MAFENTTEYEVEVLKDTNEEVVVNAFSKAINIKPDEVEPIYLANSIVYFTFDGAYEVEQDEDSWLIVDESTPDEVLEYIEEIEDNRYADIEATSGPIEYTVGFRNDDNIWNTSWRSEKVRPSSELGESLKGIHEVQLHIRLSEDDGLVITGVDLWPNNTDIDVQYDLE